MCYDGDTVDLIRSNEQKARTPHPCAECGRTIQAGETYLYECWVYEGSFDTLRTCGQCAAARRWLVEVCSSWQYNWLGPELREHWDEDPIYRSLGLGRLILCGANRWKRNGDLVPVERVRAWCDDALRRVPALARD